MAECDLEFADKTIEHLAVQFENDLASRFKLQAGTPPSSDYRISLAAMAHG
jgi:hypothetical protein